MLWLVALGAFVVYAEGWVRSSVHQWHANWSFVRTLNAGPASPRTGGRPNLPPVPWMGRLEIPRIELSVMINEGAGRESLARGVGHIEGTASPGGGYGNAGLAGHRDTYFRRLGELRVGDQIRIVSYDGIQNYAVDEIRIVGPKDTDVLRDRGWPSLTLVTCYPFWALGPAPKRYVVHARSTRGGRID